MFLTVRFSKKKAIIAVVAAAAIIVGIILLAANSHSRANSPSARTAQTNAERVKFLEAYGWEIDEKALETQEIIIPEQFGDVYAHYNELQVKQGFDLSKYGGERAVRYTYRILNFTDSTVNAVADIIICGGVVVAGDVQNNALDGYMTTLDGKE